MPMFCSKGGLQSSLLFDDGKIVVATNDLNYVVIFA